MILLLALAAALACSDSSVTPRRTAPSCDAPRVASGNPAATNYTYRVINSHPHATDAGTQGLIWDDTALVEGTGYNPGPSTLARVDLETGTVLQIREMPDPRAFGEGVTRVGERIVQLTWVRNTAYVYDAATFDSTGVFTYPTQGWGLTHDGCRFIMSDGTDTLYFRDFDTFEETGRVNVTRGGSPLRNLNELEYIDGEVWANVYQTNQIVMIDPATGNVTGTLDLGGILANPEGVLNGIAYDADSCRVFVTGKRWRRLFEIALVPE